MKVKGAAFERALTAIDPAYRLFFAYGPDEATSRAQVDRLAKAMGDAAERIDLDGSALKDDPARLSDEAAAFSMFASKRWVRVQAGDEALAAIEALLEAPPTDNPVVLISGDLKKTSALVKRLESDPAVLCCQNYLPEVGDAADISVSLARDLGLRLDYDCARRIVAGCAGDQAVMRQELTKYALYLDASPEAPRELAPDVIDALAADTDEGDLGRLVNAVMDGRAHDVAAEVALLGDDAVRILNLLAARVLLLARLRADVDAGTSAATALERGARGLFWKERPLVSAQLQRWSASRLATAHTRLLAARRTVMASSGSAQVVVEAELIAIARAATRR